MSGLQRDHSVNENWTNHEGYNDGTAGAAITNVLRQQRQPQEPVKMTKKPPTSDNGTRYIQVAHKGAIPKPKPKQAPQTPKQKTPDEVTLKAVRTIYTIMQMIAKLQGLTINAITLQDKANQREYNKSDLDAPQPPK